MTHRTLEQKGLLFGVLMLVVVLIGGIVEIVPLYAVKASVPPLEGVKPYSPLELDGRDIYIREGCYTCHSQMVRPFRDEMERYGPYSKAGEYVYDRPFQWGSKRTGPDLQRLGGKYPDSWHYLHMKNPREIVPGSIMPAYPWLFTQQVDHSLVPAKMRALQRLGVPYTDEEIANYAVAYFKQASSVETNIKAAGIKDDYQNTPEIIALIAYLQRLGSDIKWR
ncbi:MAG: hypothetical protein AMXMBFR33_38000 [Candidatus Xenobia bacterium]